MELFETSWRDGWDNYIRVFNDETGKSKAIKIPNKYEYYRPCANGEYTYVYDADMRMEKCEGNGKQARDQYGVFSPIDRYVRDHFWRTGYNQNPRIWYLDIETRSGTVEPGFPVPEKALEPVVLIQIYDTFDKKMYVLGTRKFTSRNDYVSEYEYVYVKCNDERELLETFLTIFKKKDPLIVYAWNGSGFDYPYIFNRLKNIGLYSSKLSNYGIATLKENTKGNQIEFNFSSDGHCFLDLKDIYEKFSFNRLPSYSLSSVAQSELNDDKIDHKEFLDFDSFYTGKNYHISDKPYDDPVREEIRQAKIAGKNCDEQLQFRFVWYGMQDVWLMKKIDDKLSITQTIIGIAQEMGCGLKDTMGTVRPWSQGLQNLYHENKYVCPIRTFDEGDVDLIGGFVREPDAGIHRWVMNFDVNSMYPMLSINGFNMSPETFVPMHKLPADLRDHLLMYFNDQDVGKRLTYGDDVWNRTIELLKKYNVSLAANGAVFSHNTRGIIPKRVSEIYTGRKKDKKTMIAYEKQAEVIKEILASRGVK